MFPILFLLSSSIKRGSFECDVTVNLSLYDGDLIYHHSVSVSEFLSCVIMWKPWFASQIYTLHGLDFAHSMV